MRKVERLSLMMKMGIGVFVFVLIISMMASCGRGANGYVASGYDINELSDYDYLLDSWNNSEDVKTEDVDLIDDSIFEAMKTLLSRYPTTFSYGDSRDSGELYSREFKPEYGHIWFDSTGTRIDEPSFVIMEVIPFGFVLYDLDGEDIPTVMIFHSPMNFGGGSGWFTLYRYVDGEYREVITSTDGIGEDNLFRLGAIVDFFADSTGRVLLMHVNEVLGEFGYDEINFIGNIAYINSIVELIYPYLYNSSSGERIGSVDEFLNHRVHQHNLPHQTVFGMPDITITPIPRLYELEQMMLSSLRSHHGLE